MAKSGAKNLRATLLLLARLVLGGVMAAAGVLKLRDTFSFYIEITHYKLPLPDSLQRFVAITLPWSELVAGVMLIFGIWTRAAALLNLAMTVIFAGVVSSAIARDLNIECGCFGKAGGTKVGLVTLSIDLACLSLALLIYYLAATTKKSR